MTTDTALVVRMTAERMADRERRKAEAAAQREAARARRDTEHERYKAAAKASREAERARRREAAEARAAARNAARAASAVMVRKARMERSHNSLMRRVFGLKRPFTSAACETECGLPFISMEFGHDPFGPLLFVLQRDPDSTKQIIANSVTGEVVARGASREAALRNFAKTLTPLRVLPQEASKNRGWREALRAEHARRMGWAEA